MVQWKTGRPRWFPVVMPYLLSGIQDPYIQTLEGKTIG